jgi:hypothetical protein
MGRKRKPSTNDVAPKGVPTLGRLLGLESRGPRVSSDVPEPKPAVHEPQELLPGAHAEGSADCSSEPAPRKARRFILDHNAPIMAYFEFKLAKPQGSQRNVELYRCVPCDAGEEPKWSVYKQDSALKHLGKRFDGNGNLIDRIDRCSGASHDARVREYEEKLKVAANPGVLHSLYCYIIFLSRVDVMAVINSDGSS